MTRTSRTRPEEPRWTSLGDDLFLFRDSCNVYVLKYGDRALAVDFGTGAWVARLPEIGVGHLEHVVLTHLHRDQCCGLYRVGEPGRDDHDFETHFPVGDSDLARPEMLARFWQTYQEAGCPRSYSAPRVPFSDAVADMSTDGERIIGPSRFCAIATPGHTAGALSYIVEWHGRQLAFCGDAAHSGGTLHQPFHLEWDHWTPGGAREAWYGLERLAACRIDLLLPSHGPVIDSRTCDCLRRTQRRIMGLIRAKGSVCAGEKNRWMDVELLSSGARRILPHLYAYGGNGYLLVSEKTGEGLAIDPTAPDMPHLERLLEEIGIDRIGATTATHYHRDHSDALDYVRQRYDARVWLHPWVADPLQDRNRYDLPWLPVASIEADRLLPEEGRFRWHEYELNIRPFPGQTWYHCAFHTQVDDLRVLFSGDNFQPPTRWNGTGGFCAFNGSRFGEGFARSARAVLDIAPELICNGHGIIYRFAPSHYRRILSWTARAERAVQALCPSSRWLDDYDPRTSRWDPFVSPAVHSGAELTLHLVYRNHSDQARALEVTPVPALHLEVTPARRRARVQPGATHRFRFTLRLGAQLPPGRQILAADLKVDGVLQAEACVALIDIASASPSASS
jgi:glyoxylase-like metal-dependent hydrolase (beta-lactamase superfamily II)